MPPRRGRGRRSNAPARNSQEPAPTNDDAANADVEMSDASPDKNSQEAGDTKAEGIDQDAPSQNGNAEAEFKPSENDITYPYQIKVTNLPASYHNEDLLKYIASTFKVNVPHVSSPKSSSPWVLLCFSDKSQQEDLLRVLQSHVWRKKTLRCIAYFPLESRKRKREDGDDDQELKKNKTEEEEVLTMEDEIVAESLPLRNIPYEEQKKKRSSNRQEKIWMTEEIKDQLDKTRKLYIAWKSDIDNESKKDAYKLSRNESTKVIKNAKHRFAAEEVWFINPQALDQDPEDENRLSRQDAVLMSERLHGLLCEKNKTLAGWAEKSNEDNGGTLFKLGPLKTCPNIRGYRAKCKFRIGKNSEGESTVGFGLSDVKSKVLEVAPGDKLIHLPDNMKLAAQKFQEFLRTSSHEPVDRKAKTGVWDNVIIRMGPEDKAMVIVVVSPNGLNEEALQKVKEDLVAFYTTGNGKDTNVFSIFIQILSDTNPLHPPNKLHHVYGATDYQDIICGFKFHISPFSILNMNPCSSENIYNSIVELSSLTPETVVIDVCAGSSGIAFTCAKYCLKAYAIEPQEENFKDAEKTKALNADQLTNVEIINGKCEDHLEKILDEVKDKDVVVVLNPPRHGVVAKVISLIRSRENVKKVIYVCSNTKTGVRNILDLAAAEGKDSHTGIVMSGLPFLPTEAIAIDVAPFTINNTIALLLERVDPSTFPEATKPPPVPSKKEGSKKKGGAPQQARRRRGNAGPGQGRGSVRGVRGGGVRGNRGPRGPPFSGPTGRFGPPPFMRAPPLMGRSPGPGPRGGRWNDQSSLISKYERRIAELEEQDRAFKAGLSMGLQAFNRQGGSGNTTSPRNMGDYSTGEAFGGYRGGYKDPYGDSSNSWQGNSYGGGQGSGFGGNSRPFSQDVNFNDNSPGSFGNSFSSSSRPAPLVNSRFVGMGNARSSGGRFGGNSGGGGGSGGGFRGGNKRGGRGGGRR